MKNKLKQYTKNLNIQRHESGDRWYAPKNSNLWKPSVTTIIGATIHKGIGFDKISWDTLKEYGIADIKATKCLADYQLDILKTTYKEFI